jgi:hypothetical protein
VRKFSKPILIVAGVAGAICVIGVVAANLYLQSNGVQERIRAAASAAAGMPVEIRSTSYLPWSGLVVSGVSVPGAGAGEEPLIRIDSIGVQFRFSALLAGKFVVSGVTVHGPVLNARQTSDGSWERPPAAKPSSPPQTSIAGGAEGVAEGAAIAEAKASPSREAAILPEKIRIKQGAVFLNDANGGRTGILRGVEVTLKPAPDGTISGKFKVSEGEFFGRLIVSEIRGTIFWRRDHFEIPGLEAQWAGGVVTGGVVLNWGSEARFVCHAKVSDVSLKKLASDSGVLSEGADGFLFGTGELTGVTGDPKTFKGSARIELRSARFVPVDFVRQIGEMLAIDELQIFELQEATADLVVSDEQVVATKVLLESRNLAIEAAGPVSFGGELNLDAKLQLNEKLRKGLRALVGRSLVASEREGYMALPFSVSGTVSRPESNLLEKIAGMKISSDVGNVLQNFLRMPASKKPKKDAAGTPAQHTDG